MFFKTYSSLKDALKACMVVGVGSSPNLLIKVVEKVKFLARCLTIITVVILTFLFPGIVLPANCFEVITF